MVLGLCWRKLRRFTTVALAVSFIVTALLYLGTVEELKKFPPGFEVDVRSSGLNMDAAKSRGSYERNRLKQVTIHKLTLRPQWGTKEFETL
jgi:hypothetical protein